MNKNIKIQELGDSFAVIIDISDGDLEIRRQNNEVILLSTETQRDVFLDGFERATLVASLSPEISDWPGLTIDELEIFNKTMSEYPKTEAYNWENLFHQHNGILLYTPGERSQKLLCEEWVVIMKDAINQFWSEQQPAGGLQDTDALFSEWAKKPRTPCGDN